MEQTTPQIEATHDELETAWQDTIHYVAKLIQPLLRLRERVLICYPKQAPGQIGWIMEQAARQAGAAVYLWEPDLRWKSLLWQAFSAKVKVIIGAPPVLLGLGKLARAEGVPLYARQAVLTGYAGVDWMAEGIGSVLDTKNCCFYFPGHLMDAAGFSAPDGNGFLLRQERFLAEAVDREGNVLAEGEVGRLLLAYADQPDKWIETGERGSVCREADGTVRLLNVNLADDGDLELAELMKTLLRWTSVLDCRLFRSPAGLEVEMVTFPGEKLPKLPNCARKVVRPWNPERDVPFQVRSMAMP